MRICTRDNNNPETDVTLFEATKNSAYMVQRCPSCDMIHILLFKDRGDKLASHCIDISDSVAEQLIVALVKELAATQQRRGPDDTLN